MAKLPAIPQQPGLAEAQARRLALRRSRLPSPKKGGGGGVQLFLLGLGFIGMAVFAAPTCVLLVFGMVPSIVAYVVDRGKRPMQAFTIAPLNLAGLMPYLLELWTGHDQMPTVVHLFDQRLCLAGDLSGGRRRLAGVSGHAAGRRFRAAALAR